MGGGFEVKIRDHVDVKTEMLVNIYTPFNVYAMKREEKHTLHTLN